MVYVHHQSGSASTPIIMASSLKAYAPLLAWRLGTTPAALYERQRALVRDGILDQSAGRGPGSGVQVGPYPVALLLVAVLATDSLSETAEKVRIFAAAKASAEDGLCPLTAEQNFVQAVARVLDRSLPHWRNIETITVRRTSGLGVIASRDSHMDSIFAAQLPLDAKLASTKLVVNAMLTRDLIIDIATDLKKFADLEKRNRSDALQIRAQPGQRVETRGHRQSSRTNTAPKKERQ
ncbi:MAG: hypothetical protein C5B58_00790 [Acidobacteria bacterium]|nr:MAG: hypothetical protein C5B58_00790 [Acidobacteriota bacterium]